MTKTIISSENSVNDTVELEFPCAVCRKGVHSNSILCKFCGCWVNKKWSGIRGKLKYDGNLAS